MAILDLVVLEFKRSLYDSWMKVLEHLEAFHWVCLKSLRRC